MSLTAQCCERDGLAYELSCPHGALCISFFPPHAELDFAADSRWRIEARTSGAAEAPIVTAWGRTRRRALEEVAARWDGRARTVERWPDVDWDEVAAILEEAHGIQ